MVAFLLNDKFNRIIVIGAGGFALEVLDWIQDFSEASLAGMFVDMAAYVGDVMSYYLDHQFNELSLETAMEDENVERLIRESGIKMLGASPSSANVDFSIIVDATLDASTQEYIPDPEMLCTVKVGTILTSVTGPVFELLEDIDFSKKDANNVSFKSVSLGTSSKNTVVLKT